MTVLVLRTRSVARPEVAAMVLRARIRPAAGSPSHPGGAIRAGLLVIVALRWATVTDVPGLDCCYLGGKGERWRPRQCKIPASGSSLVITCAPSTAAAG